ncbi:unnamed protein product [Brugia timori]|uniref:Uncharacterized protein n=1 Tax=Brugia timori TaxID=42155 RepID=A0A3P7X0Y7_9BILA|nr:unnamed protein product [Brugia timori]
MPILGLIDSIFVKILSLFCRSLILTTSCGCLLNVITVIFTGSLCFITGNDPRTSNKR